MEKAYLFSKTLIISLLCFVCVCVVGCLTTADYEEIYNDNTRIVTCSSNTRKLSVESSVGNEYSWSCSSFSGVCSVKKIDTSSQVNLSLKVEQGKFKIVVIDGQTVYTLAEGNHEGALDFTGVPSGSYTLKAVGVEAEFSLKLS